MIIRKAKLITGWTKILLMNIRKIGFNHSDLDQNRIQLSLDCVR